ncbi:hypothetical protein [Siminovitchia sp. FSL W7-1587]|uniref:hypothetical protein n=1 Tax=Siminovitchia sp. FSL W7-1587 TaxID=2954699 RepID=UPI0030D12136
MAFLHIEEIGGEITNVAVQMAGSSPSTMLGYRFAYSLPKDVALYIFENREEAVLDGETLKIKDLSYVPVAYNFLGWKNDYVVDSFGYIQQVERVLADAEGGIYVEPDYSKGKPVWDFEKQEWKYEAE